jgi:DNA repair protein RecO (recombination protein O)
MATNERVAATGGRGARRQAAPAQPAFVLHRYDWSESSLILDLFTRDSGRVAAAAKGAKRPYSQLRSVLMPFQRVLVQFGRARGDEAAEVHSLRSAEWAGDGTRIAGDAWFAAFYLNELLMRLLARDDPHEQLFDAYAATLQGLSCGAEAEPEAVLRAFELLLLRETGVLPQLDRVTLTQQPVAEDQWYALRPEQGLVATGPAEGALRGSQCLALAAALDALAHGASGCALAPLQSACADAQVGLKAQLRAQLHYHLGGTKLRTRQIMVESHRLLATEPSTSSP